jgi:hypothetical protein
MLEPTPGLMAIKASEYRANMFLSASGASICLFGYQQNKMKAE